MLDKIVNIKSTLQYQRDKGVQNNPDRGNLEEILAGAVKYIPGVKDSIRFSPAAHFIARINWQLKDLVFDSTDKLIIAFSIGAFDFQTEVDFLNFHTSPRQFYEIKSGRLIASKPVRAQVRISSAKRGRFPRDEKPELKFQGLNEFFNRVYSLELTGEIDKYYSSVLHELMDRIEETLIAEFDYINAALFTLVDKISPGKLAHNLVFNDGKNEPLIIEKIKVLND